MDLTKPTPYRNPSHQALIQSLERELTIYATTQGRQNGAVNKPATPLELRAFIQNTVEAKVQAMIDLNQEVHTPISGMAVAYKVEKEAKEKVKPLLASLNEDDFTMQELVAKQNACTPNLFKRKIRKLIYLAAFIISLTETFFAYDSLRYAGLTRIAAFISSLGIGAAIGFGIHAFASYIQKATNKVDKYKRMAIVLIPAFIGFFVLAQLRANGINEEASVNLSTETVLPTSHISSLPLAIISFLLFAVTLMFSICYVETEDEQRLEQEYDLVTKAIRKLKRKMDDTRQEIEQIQSDAANQAALALRVFEYALSIENRLQAIARQVIQAYCESNLRHRTDGLVPEFMSYPPAFNFTLFFDNIKTEKL